MKKNLFALLLALSMTLSLAACGGSTETPETDNDTPAVEENQPTETPDVETETPDAEVETETPDAETEEPAPEEQPEATTPEVKPEPKPEETTPSAPAASIDLLTFYNDLYEKLYPLDAEGFGTGPSTMNLFDMPEMLENYYPSLAALTKQGSVYVPMMSAVPYEVALIEVNSAADVDAAKAILQARIDTEAVNQGNYPMVQENWELNSRIVTNGNYILMVVAEDHAAYIEAFNALFA